jgi:hypothetical protein
VNIQFVQIKDTCSEFYEITCGVPQGSILGPLLFILYVNDLQKALKQATSSLFADDTHIYYSHSDVIQPYKQWASKPWYLDEIKQIISVNQII